MDKSKLILMVAGVAALTSGCSYLPVEQDVIKGLNRQSTKVETRYLEGKETPLERDRGICSTCPAPYSKEDSSPGRGHN